MIGKNLDHSSVLEQAMEQNVLIDPHMKLLSNFLKYIQYKSSIQSRLYQDLFASFVVSDQYEKTFFEFGATDGLNLSNTYTLENLLKWKGALAEPSPQWHRKLKENRKGPMIITDCIWSESHKGLEYFVSDYGESSCLNDFKESDKDSMLYNTTLRTKNGKTVTVKTISLNDVIENFLMINVLPTFR